MIDIDHFKKVNDGYGHQGRRSRHQTGRADRAHRRAPGRPRHALRRRGIPDGAAGASADDCARIGERLRRLVWETPLVTGGHSVRVTLSVGGASFPACSAKNAVDSVRIADEALYAAKEAGRNRVFVHGNAEIAAA